MSFLRDLGLVRFSKGGCLVEKVSFGRLALGRSRPRKSRDYIFSLDFPLGRLVEIHLASSTIGFLPLTFGVFANHLSVLQGCLVRSPLGRYSWSTVASFGSDRGSSISAFGCGLQWWLAPMVVGSSGPWLSQLLLLHCTAKAILCMGSGGCRSLRAGRGYGRWESVTFSMFFLT